MTHLPDIMKQVSNPHPEELGTTMNSVGGVMRLTAIIGLATTVAGCSAGTSGSDEAQKADQKIEVSVQSHGVDYPDVHSVQFSEDYENCIAGLPRVDSMQCANQEFDRQDAELNRVYRSTMARLPKDKQITLRELERDWIAGLEEHCEVQSEEGFGPVALNQMECLIAARISRTTWLKNYSG